MTNGLPDRIHNFEKLGCRVGVGGSIGGMIPLSKIIDRIANARFSSISPLHLQLTNHRPNVKNIVQSLSLITDS